MAVFIFIAKLIIVSGCLYGYYHLFLRNKRFHHYNRFYLLLVGLLSFIIATINIPVHFFWGKQPQSGLIQTLKVITVSGWEEPVTIYANPYSWRHWLTIQNGLYFVYLAGLVTALIAVLRSLAYINRLKNKYPFETIDQLKIFNTAEPGTPFSFFKAIFWDKNISLHDARGGQILRHELFHVKQRHSADILLMEMLCCIAWFNPFLHLIKKELRTIHEFLADEYAVSGNNRYDYAELLLLHAMQQPAPVITHPFFHNQIKRRITMITQSNLIRRGGYFSRIMALPLLLVLASAFAVKITGKSPAKRSAAYALRTLTVVIDPGHGGIFPGAQNENGLLEKNITLSLAKKIEALAKNYNINVVLTRNSDGLVGNASNLKEDLQNRIALANNAKPDLFVSLHVNSTEEKTSSRSGFDVYISGRNGHTGDRELATVLLTGLKDIYAVNETIQQREIGIVVLDKSNCPAVCLECGYITNAQDVLFITNPANQEKVARKILEGLMQYSLVADRKETTHTETKPIADTALIAGPEVKEKLQAAAKKQLDKSIIEKTFSETEIKDTIPAGKDVIFTKVENEADYPGGQPGWSNYLMTHLKYPESAVKKNIQGTVVVQFIVDQEGKVSDVKAISGPKELQEASIKVIKESGNWTSATQNGRKVKAYKKQPITYKLSAS
jgi:TonB family protein